MAPAGTYRRAAVSPDVALASSGGAAGGKPSTGSDGSLRTRPVLVTLLATVVALLVGLWELGRRSLWYDEAFTVGIVDRPMGDVLWRLTHWEVNQSPYYLLFSGWFRIDQGEAFLRSMSVAFAVAAVPAIFVLGRRIADARVGAVAAVLLAVHPLVVQWGQQLRSYSMVVLMVILATIALLRAVDEPDDTGRAVVYGVVAAATIYTQFFALLVVAVHLLWAVLAKPMPRRVVVAAGGAVGVLVLPLAWYLLTYEGDPLVWLAGRGDDALLATARGLAGGRGLNVVAYAVAAATGVWALARQARGDGLASLRVGRAWRPVLPLLWAVVPVLVAALVTYTAKPVLEARFLIVVVPGLVLLVAHGLCRLPWRPVAAAILATLLLVSLAGVRTWHEGPVLEDWRAAVPVAIENAGPDGALVLDPRLSLFAVRYYRPDGARFRLAGPDLGDGPIAPRLVEVIRVHQEPRELQPLYFLWRDTHYERIDAQDFAGLSVITYVARR